MPFWLKSEDRTAALGLPIGPLDPIDKSETQAKEKTQFGVGQKSACQVVKIRLSSGIFKRYQVKIVN